MHTRLGWILNLFAALLASLVLPAASAEAFCEQVIGIVADFSDEPLGPYQQGHFDSWRWTDEFRARARTLSQIDIVQDHSLKAKALRVRILDPLPFSQGALPLLRLAPYYPPQADLLRVRIKMVSGCVQAYAGGPTAYYANSDVFTKSQRIAAAAEPQWVNVELNLHHPLGRNFRRSGFSMEAPRNYYNRWAQEPLGIYLSAENACELLIDRIELVAQGEGQPFAEFTADEVRHVKTIADFENGSRQGVVNLYMANAETEWFEQSWKREKPLRFIPTELKVRDDPARRTKSLVCSGPVAEEVHCTAIKTAGADDANAIRLTVQHDAPEYRNTVIGMGRAEAMDFLVMVAPPGRPFAWQSFEPDPGWRSQAEPGFDYQFSYRLIRDRTDIDLAIYQTRRYLRPQEWTTLVLPAADFTCIYGSGAYRDRYLRHEPLTCGDVIAVAWLNPWCRLGRRQSTVTVRIDALDFVHVPGTPSELRSFPQINDLAGVRWLNENSARGHIRHMLLPGDEAPIFEEESRR